MEAQLQALGTGPLYPFSSWKRDAGVPPIAAGVYTIGWRGDVAAGHRRLDDRVRDYVTTHLAFRWVETPDVATARTIEATIRRGQWEHGRPFLNPG